ncbi:MAG: carbon storage regulator CsrA [Dethiosulfovibrio sp.]|nr:carbon storage regulator CsrA [Dethiosulfovibrio sp.]
MLVLARKKGESVKIGEDIEVKVLDVNGDTVKIGVTAPASVAIWRNELYCEVADTNRRASQFNWPSSVLDETLSKLKKERESR